jgi:hypothetical protein
LIAKANKIKDNRNKIKVLIIFFIRALEDNRTFLSFLPAIQYNRTFLSSYSSLHYFYNIASRVGSDFRAIWHNIYMEGEQSAKPFLYSSTTIKE